MKRLLVVLLNLSLLLATTTYADQATQEQIAEFHEGIESGEIDYANLGTFLMSVGDVEGKVFQVVIDYDRQSFFEMKFAGDYRLMDRDINCSNFPISGKGIVISDLEIIQLEKFVSRQKWLDEIEERGYRSATIEEFLVFGSTYKEVQKKFSIISLGLYYVDINGKHKTPWLNISESERRLDILRVPLKYFQDSAFLVVRK